MNDWKMNGKPALLILHMQRGIIGEGNLTHSEFAKVVKESGIIPLQQDLLRAFRKKESTSNICKFFKTSGRYYVFPSLRRFVEGIRIFITESWRPGGYT